MQYEYFCMITYNPKDWFYPIIHFHKSDTFRKLLPLLILIGLITWGIAFYEIKYLKLSENSHVKNITLMHNLLGFAISMLLVFRTNTAYDRWWEGRKLWGSLVNNSRNLSIKIEAYFTHEMSEEKAYLKNIIKTFPEVLRLHLLKESTRLQLDNHFVNQVGDVDKTKHVPAQLVLRLQKKLAELHANGKLSTEQLLLMNTEVTGFLDICGACERIKNTPIPYSYSSFIKKFIFIYVLTLPMGFAFSLGYIAIPVVIFVFYVLASLELIAEEIEDPFGTDVNDLPMDIMSMNIRNNVEEIIGE